MSFPITCIVWKERQDLCHSETRRPERHFCISAETAIEDSVNWLIERLYEPCALAEHPWGTIRALDTKQRTKPFDTGKEPINWGDLSASVEDLGNTFIVTLAEASPGQCPGLCGYVAYWLKAWGWNNIRVETEW